MQFGAENACSISPSLWRMALCTSSCCACSQNHCHHVATRGCGGVHVRPHWSLFCALLLPCSCLRAFVLLRAFLRPYSGSLAFSFSGYTQRYTPSLLPLCLGCTMCCSSSKGCTVYLHMYTYIFVHTLPEYCWHSKWLLVAVPLRICAHWLVCWRSVRYFPANTEATGGRFWRLSDWILGCLFGWTVCSLWIRFLFFVSSGVVSANSQKNSPKW